PFERLGATSLPSERLGATSLPSERLGATSLPSERLGATSLPSERLGATSLPSERLGATSLDVKKVRGDFPALLELVHGHRLVYLDNAATTQKPRAVLEAMNAFYVHDCANVHRAA